jgi:hypothetical protein
LKAKSGGAHNDAEKLEGCEVGNKLLRQLLADLNNDEVRQTGEALAHALSKEAAINSELERVKNDFKTRLVEIKTRIQNLARAVSTRREQHQVECTEYLDFKKGLVYVVRDDLGRITETRELTARERQQKLPEKEKVKTKTAAAGGGAKEQTK